MRALLRALAIGLVAASSLACSPTVGKGPVSPSQKALQDGPSSADGEVVGRWMLAELIAPGGTPEGAQKARKRLDELGAKGMLASLARGIDDSSHGQLKDAGTAYLDALKAARASGDRLAPVVAWYAVNHLLTVEPAVPTLWKEAKPFVSQTIASPGSVGWRARGEMVEWWSRHAFEEAEANLLEQTAMRYGCARDVRLAGPFGHGAPADKWRHFPAEAPGPWPARWPADPLRAHPPRVLKSERHGCTTRVEEPVAGGIFYAEAYVDVPASRELIVAVQGALEVWIDDHSVLDRDPRSWGVWPRFGAHVRLDAGRHRVLARLTEPDSSIRLLAPDGTPSDAQTSADIGGTYSLEKPRTVADPNVLDRYVASGNVKPPGDEVEAYLASYLAAIEGQFDLANVLIEPLITDQEKATPVVLTSAASYTEKDPIFPDGEARDLGRALREKAVGRDPKLYFPRLWLVLDHADKSMPDAARAVKAMVDEFPEVPEVTRVLATLYGRLGWKAERVQTSLEMVKRFPQDRGALEGAIPALEAAGQNKEADELAVRLKALYPDSEIDLDRALARHDYKAAIAELQRLGVRRPDRKDIADRIANLMVRSGEKTDPVAEIERMLRRSPRDASLRLSLADARFAKGDRGALRTALAAAIQQGADVDDLRGAIELIEGMTELEPYRLDPWKTIRDYEKDPEALSGTAARVLDYSTLWVHPDGAARMLEHEIIRVQSQEAISKLAEQRVPPGALVLRIRVLKKGGQELEPERVEGKPTVTMPHLEVGDYIETEYVTSTDGDGEGGKRYVGPHWFFREADIAYWRSEFIVISPRDRQLLIETTGQVPAPELREQGPLAIRRWRVDRSPAAAVEPDMVPITEFLPSVRIGWGISLENQLDRMLEATVEDIPRDPRLARVARRIIEDGPAATTAHEKARRLYRWVLANVEEGRETDGRKVLVGKSGSRATGFLYLARALNLPVELAVVRDRLRPREEGPISGVLSFSQLALRLDRSAACPRAAAQPQDQAPAQPPAADPACAPLWFTVGDRYTPFGFMPAELRGQPAVRLVQGLPRDTTTTQGSFDGIVYQGEAELRSDGSAMLNLDQRFAGKLGIGLRSSVEQLPEEQLKSVVESRLLARALPGARLVKLSVEDKDDLDKPLTLRMQVEVSDFARRRGNTLALKPPLMLKIAGMARLEERQTPMLLPEATHSEVHLSIKLPRGASVQGPLTTSDVRDGDRVLALTDAIGEGTLSLGRVLDLPAGRVTVGEYQAFKTFTQQVDDTASREIIIQLP
jgi:cellulose synthase operon protein C